MKMLSAKIVNGSKCLLAGVTALLSLGTSHSVMALNISQTPLFLTQPVRPIMMLNMSNDHQLYFKAYDDYSDLDGDGRADLTYNNNYAYYGYFNSDLCYTHTGGVFTPAAWASNHYCTDSRWSGNFLNWATMTRIDTVRKILYGGKRFTDTAELTVLERAMLPQDAHSFAKYYNGTDINRLTPYAVTSGTSETANTGITICNTTSPSPRGHSQAVTSAPLMKVVAGNYSLWASNERWQCRLGNYRNDNDSSVTGIYAHPVSPSSTLATLAVRVKACDSGFVNEENNENCKGYANDRLKPTGLLQAYGEDDSILFGLMTGSYNRNKSGGVLRKNVSSMTNEINPVDGTFMTPATGGSIIATLDALRIVGYDFNEGTYNSADNCSWALSAFTDGRCTNWGNPQSEIYLESLRYLAGLTTSTGAFNANDSGKLSALSPVAWVDPIDDSNHCSPLSVIQFNASTSSYDGDQISGATGIGLTNVSAATDKVGAGEGITGGSFFVGSNGTDNNQLCTAKTISNLSSVSGTCPDAPRLEGSYQIAGLAYHARTEGIMEGRQTVQTFGVALAPAVPKVDVPVPGGGVVTILPACRNLQTNPDTNCAIVDFKIIEQEFGDINTGRLYVNWEDSEQGGDFDQDMWGLIEYSVSSDKVEITTEVVAQSTGDPMGFGYVISGTTDDGFHVHSGVNNFTYGDACTMTTAWNGSNNQNVSTCSCRFSGSNGRCSTTLSQMDGVNTKEFDIGTSTASLLQQPLYYAAKWGGFEIEDNQGNTFTEPPDDTNPTYFFATDPRQLEESLEEALEVVAQGVGSAASVATNSTRIGTNTFIYQALFNSQNWHGDLKAFQISAQGTIGSIPAWVASGSLGSHTARNIITLNGTNTVDFQWANLSDMQQRALNKNDADALGPQRLRWLRGDNVTGFRERTNEQRIGDIVNSDPAFFGTRDYGFGRMSTHGGPSYAAHVSSKENEVIYVNSNGGMLHAFDANTGAELFAYVPAGVYDKISRLPDSNYGSSVNPHVFTADGQVVVSDIYADGWKTILVGALGAGGRGVFVLDVTDPGNPSVIGELNTTDVGQVIGKPAVVPLPNGNWAIAFGNGYNSTGGQAKLILVQLNATGTGLLPPVVMNTGVGGDNGLAEPSFSIKGNGTVNFAYAGDRLGNMWRFDMNNINGSPSLLFSAGADQPITAAPVLGINRLKRDANGSPRTMVYFGTGQYLTTADLGNTAVQSFYGIADTGVSLTREDLRANTINTGAGTRTVTEAQAQGELDWPEDDVHGWYVDFPGGERVVTKAMLLFDRLIFPTVVPNENACDFGGTSWIMSLTGVGDLYSDYPPFIEPVEMDTLVSLSDLILPGGGGGGGGGGGDGDGDGDGDGSSGCEEGLIIVQKSDGSLTTINPCVPSAAFGRQSWRQLR